jgi:hypothetical protein
MTWVAVAVGGASLIGGVIAGQGAKSAAHTQANSSQYAADLQKNMYDQTVAREQPYVQAGYGAVNTLSGMMGQLNKPFTADMMKEYSPAYQFQMQQGQQGVLNQASNSQGALSGAALKDLTAYNQGFANTAFNNAFNQYQTQQNNVFNRLSGLATLGQGAASNQATGGSNYANSIGNSISNVGSALGAGQVGQANAYSSALSNAAPWLAYGGGGSSTPTTDANGFAIGSAQNMSGFQPPANIGGTN